MLEAQNKHPTATSHTSVASTRQVPTDECNATADNSPQASPIEVDRGQDPIDLSEEECNSGECVGVKRKLRFTSKVWQEFQRIKIGEEWKAVCNHCKSKLVGDSSKCTTRLRNHLDRCHFRKQGNSNAQQGIFNFTKDNSGKCRMGTFTFDQDKCRNSLEKAIVLHEYPLSMVDHIGFKNFLNDLQPMFKVPSRNTIKNDILKMYEYEKSKVMIALEMNESRISITTNMWTSSNQKNGFMMVTAHYIDDSWTLQSRIMRFVYVPCPHTANVLSQTLIGCLLDWNVDRKLSTLTVDNCTTNDDMINLVLSELHSDTLLLGGEFFHIRCCAHMLNLIVKDGLDIISTSVENIRDSVAYWTATPKRSEKFEQFARQLKVGCEKKLTLDCKTRWDSTYLMLRTALLYKDVFLRLRQREVQYRCLPSDEDWDLAKEMSDRLEIFFEVTELFSGTKYPTAYTFFPYVCEIKLSLSEWLESPYEVIQMMANTMIDRFNKYWSEIYGILALATVLDPRYKMKLVEYYYSLIFKEQSSYEIEKLSHICRKLVKEYDTKQDSSGIVSQSSSYCQFGLSTSRKTNSLAGFYEFLSTSSPCNVKTELDKFLDEPILPRSDDFDILAWWKINAIQYPTLSKVARDVLAIPISTVSSQSAFSTAGRFVIPHRNRLHPKTLETLMCAQDWLWAEIHKNSTTSTYSRDEESEEPSYAISSSNVDTFDS